jgi:hypothetical protein
MLSHIRNRERSEDVRVPISESFCELLKSRDLESSFPGLETAEKLGIGFVGVPPRKRTVFPRHAG